jgi:hypothetical protein
VFLFQPLELALEPFDLAGYQRFRVVGGERVDTVEEQGSCGGFFCVFPPFGCAVRFRNELDEHVRGDKVGFVCEADAHLADRHIHDFVYVAVEVFAAGRCARDSIEER